MFWSEDEVWALFSSSFYKEILMMPFAEKEKIITLENLLISAISPLNHKKGFSFYKMEPLHDFWHAQPSSSSTSSSPAEISLVNTLADSLEASQLLLQCLYQVFSLDSNLLPWHSVPHLHHARLHLRLTNQHYQGNFVVLSILWGGKGKLLLLWLLLY